MALVAICRSAYKEPVEGLVSLVDLVVLESVSELCEERPVGVGVFCAVSLEEEGVQQQVLRKDLMQQVLNLAALKMMGLGCGPNEHNKLSVDQISNAPAAVHLHRPETAQKTPR